MAEATVIGRGTRINGRVSGQVDLEILGQVDGEIAVDGDVTVDAQGLVGASVSGRRVVVRGAIRGDLVGEEAVVLEDGARVVGDVRAPRIAIAPGALVRGYVQTGEGGAAPAARPAVSRATPAPATKSVRAAPPPARPAPAPARTAAPAPAVVPAAPAAPAARPAVVSALAGAPPAAPAAKQGPPPPIVPALKKGVKGALKKKA